MTSGAARQRQTAGSGKQSRQAEQSRGAPGRAGRRERRTEHAWEPRRERGGRGSTGSAVSLLAPLSASLSMHRSNQVGGRLPPSPPPRVAQVGSRPGSASTTCPAPTAAAASTAPRCGFATATSASAVSRLPSADIEIYAHRDAFTLQHSWVCETDSRRRRCRHRPGDGLPPADLRALPRRPARRVPPVRTPHATPRNPHASNELATSGRRFVFTASCLANPDARTSSS